MSTDVLSWWPAAVALAAVVLWPLRYGGGAAGPRGLGRLGVGRTAARTATRAVARLGPRRRDGVRTAAVPTVSELADSLVLLALALKSGLPTVEGLHEVASSAAGPVRADLSAVVAALRWGRPAAEAWAFAGPAWQPVASALQVAEETGAAAADVVADTAARLRELHERQLERRAGQAGVLLVLPLGLLFLPAFVCTAVVPVVLALTRGLVSS